MKSLPIMIFLLLLSCNSETGNSNHLSDAAVTDTRADVVPETSDDGFPFPQLESTASCGEPIRAPELCDWGRAAYDIVLLEVTKTSLILSPSIEDQTNVLTQDCDGLIEGGLRFEGIVKQSLNGLSGKIAVDVGLLQYSNHWLPRPWPLPSESGVVGWSDDRGAIKAGDVIGLTLHKHPTNKTLGILGEHFFDINPKSTIRFGELDSECELPHPKNVGGLTFEKLKEEIEKCAPNSALVDARKQAKEKVWQDPIFSHLGVCYPAS